MSEILTLLLRANLAAAGAILLILALRPVAGRLFGARVRYALWTLAPIVVSASFIPARVRVVRAPALAEQVSEATSLFATAPAALPVAAPMDWTPWVVALWIAGAALCLVQLVRRQGEFMRFARLGVGGPAVVGFLRPRIHTPADFDVLFEAEERALVLVHEQTHLRRHDAQINGLVGIAACLNWFNPLVHMAAHFVRIDQELACDETVVAAFPEARPAYARTMLKTQLATAPLPLGCYWPARNIHPLEQRIAMLKIKAPAMPCRLAGLALIAAAAAGSGYAAWAVQPARLEVVQRASATTPPPGATSTQAEGPALVPPALPAEICLTNACAGDVKLAAYPARNPAAIVAAITAGDLRGVLLAGGSAVEASDAVRAACAVEGRAWENCGGFIRGTERFVIGPEVAGPRSGLMIQGEIPFMLDANGRDEIRRLSPAEAAGLIPPQGRIDLVASPIGAYAEGISPPPGTVVMPPLPPGELDLVMPSSVPR